MILKRIRVITRMWSLIPSVFTQKENACCQKKTMVLTLKARGPLLISERSDMAANIGPQVVVGAKRHMKPSLAGKKTYNEGRGAIKRKWQPTLDASKGGVHGNFWIGP